MKSKAAPVEFKVLWSQLDINGHVRHTAYGDWAGEARHRALAHAGVTADRMQALGVGPVLIREEIRYLREVRALDHVKVATQLAGESRDLSRWRMLHRIERGDGELAAKITVEGTWLDLETRRPVVPPDELQAMNEVLERSEDFEILRSLVRGRSD